MNITKKIVAIVTTLTVFVWLGGAGSAQALTAAELQVQIDALLANLATLQSQLSALQSGGTTSSAACSGITFSRNLSQGSSGNDVKCLQSILNQSADTQIAASGTGSAGNETTYFGSLTKIAVVKFQNKYASEVLTPVGLTAGTGFVGAQTRTKLNTMTGGTPAGCSCTSWVTGACQSGTNAGKKVQTRTCTPAACSTETQYVTDAACAVGGQNKVSLAADTPAAATVAQGAQNVIFSKINFCAAETANTISKIVITRGGIAADADFSYIKLYDGVTQLGSTQALNTTNHKASFSSLTWAIPANSCKTLTVKGSIASSGATSGDTPKLSIAASTDITSTVALDGVFPIESNGMTIAGISAGLIEVSTSTSPSGSVIGGATEQPVADFILTASSAEAIKLHAVTVTEVGTSVDTDVSNIKLFYQSTQLGSTVPSLTNGEATFDLSAAPLEILAGSSKTIKVYVDVGTAVGVYDRNIKFQITDNTDITAYGSNSGGSLVIYGVDKDTDEWPLKGQQIDIDQGTLVISQDTTYSPSAQDYARGTTQNSVIAFKFSTGAYEGVRITQLKLKRNVASTSDAAIFNVTLYDAETGAVLAGPAGVVSGYATFGANTTGFDATGLFDVEKSKNRIILVKADISSAAATNSVENGDDFGFQIAAPQTDVKADGLSSRNDLATADITPSTALGSTLYHDILEKGALTVAQSPDTPSASTYAVGTNDYTFAKFDFTSTGEDILVTQLNIYFATDTAESTGTAADAADINNVELWWDGILQKTDPTLSSGYAEFGVNFTVPKNSTKSVTVKGDVPTGSDAGALQAWILGKDNITAEGKSSAVTVTPIAASWDNVKGNVMTMGAPGLVITRSDTPASQTYVKNASNVTLATIYFTASTSEDLTITRIKVAGAASSSASSSAAQGRLAINQPSSDSDWSGNAALTVRNMVTNVKLCVSGTDCTASNQLGSTVAAMTAGTASTTFDTADFTSLSLKIPKGQTKAIDIKGTVNDATTTAGDTAMFYYFGIASGTADVAGSGDKSGTALSATTIAINGLGETGNGMLLASGGNLTIAADVDSAISAMQVAGDSKVNLGSWKFTANDEGINITRMSFIVTTSTAATGTSIGYATDITNIVADSANTLLSTTTDGAEKCTHCFDYSLNDGASSTCYFAWGVNPIAASTSVDLLITHLNSASSTCWASTSVGVQADDATTTDGALTLYASSTTGADYSIEISDCEGNNRATNTVEILKLGLNRGGTEAIGKYTGTNAELGAMYLCKPDGTCYTSYLGTDADGKAIFSFADDAPLSLAKGNTVLTLKADVSTYTALTEGSTLLFALGSTIGATSDLYGKGAQSGTALAESTVATSSMDSNEMWLYSAKPTVTKNASSPTTAAAGTNVEVFRFDVANRNNAGLDLNVNAIRFTINTNASSSIFDKTFKLYRSTDPSTVIGQGTSYANATASDSVGWVTIYPFSGYQAAAGGTNTYILKANTASMDELSTVKEYLTMSIEVDDFYWDDGYAVNANKKVLNDAVTGNKLEW